MRAADAEITLLRLLTVAMACLVASASASRHLVQDAGPAEAEAPMPAETAGNATASYPTLADAIAAANTTAAGNMSILIAAVEAAGVAAALNETTAWTILAPTNEAFMELISEMNTTAEDLLANTTLLVPVLSYHVIPTAAVNSSSLTDGMNVTTALARADPLMVMVNSTSPEGLPLETPRVEFMGATNTAAVVFPDIQAGRVIIHVIDTVLVPEPAPAV